MADTTTRPRRARKARRSGASRQRLNSVGWEAPAWERMLHDERLRRRTILADAEQSIANTTAEALVSIVGEEPARNDDGSKVNPAQPDAVRLTEGVAESMASNAGMATKLLGRGLYSALYGLDRPHDKGPAWAQTVAQALGQTPGWKDLRDSVHMDPDVAAIAATRLLKEIEPQIPDLLRKLWESGQSPGDAPQKPEADENCDSEQNGPGQNNQGQGQGGEQGDEGSQGQGGAGGGQGDGQDSSPGSAMAQAAQDLADQLGSAMREAMKDAAEARGNLNGLLPGLGSVPLTEEQKDSRRLELAEALKHNEELKRVLRMAGRITRIAERVRKTKSTETPEEVVDIETGADLPRLLTSEIMGLTDPDLEALAFARFTERGMLQYKLQGTERMGRGPIVCLLDSSGSMNSRMADGMRAIQWAAAVGIACIRSGIMQHRKVSVATFDDGIRGSWIVEAGDRSAAREAILQLAGLEPGGGTSFDQPLRWGLETGQAELDRADLVLLTDGYGYCAEETIERLEEAKERDVRCWGIVVGESYPEALMDRICNDKVQVGVDAHEDAGAKIGGMGM